MLDSTKVTQFVKVKHRTNISGWSQFKKKIFFRSHAYLTYSTTFSFRLVIEFPATGGAIPSWTFRTVKLIRYVSAMDYFVLACEAIFGLFIVYYMIEETIEVSLYFNTNKSHLNLEKLTLYEKSFHW